MKTFTTPCFIRKNTKELREKLEELGYEEISNPFQIQFKFCTVTNTDGTYKYIDAFDICVYKNTHIDCSTNEALFLAIAALREDNDYGQWFWCNKTNTWIQCKALEFVQRYNTEFFKATVNELINHFK